MRGPEPLVARAAAALGRAPDAVGVAPGRINVIGEHTDYIGGLALPAAVDRYCVVALARRADGQVRLRSLDEEGAFGWTLGARPSPPRGWATYMAGAVEVFRENIGLETGFDAVVTGDVPRGGGMSSSAALCVAWMVALEALTGATLPPMDAARLAQRVEHDWAGVRCGLLDQTASRCAVPGHLLRVDFRSMDARPVRSALAGCAWLVLDTAVHRTLAGSAYAERVAQVTEGLARTGRAHWRDLAEADVGAADLLDARLRHGIRENARVDAMIEAIAAGDAGSAGRLLGESHASLRDDYAVSCDELDAMVALATAQPGCFGARMMGGGFGGCALALVEEGAAEAIGDAVLAGYRARFDHPARAFRVALVGGATGRRGSG